ncbi:hypothetical protein Micbo1qcDRAFT_197850 [Microdochium bolleyi]|uniref:Uncharacterized protein n=1 Tax=Microdochium bolleyi TaxID=196109 RepID=A0A136IRP1_9PEZI|nr:hypothetical protein Micbo1qcDRAFT_197850 [Microdochium bolleyi]
MHVDVGLVLVTRDRLARITRQHVELVCSTGGQPAHRSAEHREEERRPAIAHRMQQVPASTSLALTTASGEGIKSYAIPFRVPGSQLERQLLHHFCVEAAEDLSGYLVSDFWLRTVLRRSQDEIAVRQAVVALSSLHRAYKCGDGGKCGESSTSSPISREDAFAETRILYNKGLRSLRKQLRNYSNLPAGKDTADASNKDGDNPPRRDEKRQSLVVPLICCAIFHYYEAVRGNLNAALQHVVAGRAMLDMEQKSLSPLHNGSGEDMADLALLAVMFARFQVQAVTFDQVRYSQLLCGLGGGQDDRSQLSPSAGAGGGRGRAIIICHDRLLNDAPLSPLCSLEHAQQRVTGLQGQVLQFLSSNVLYSNWPADSLPNEVRNGKMRLQAAFESWGVQFAAILTAWGYDTPPSSPTPSSGSTEEVVRDLTYDNNTRRHHCSGNLHPHKSTLEPASMASAVRFAVSTGDVAFGALYVQYYIFYLLLNSSLPMDNSILNVPIATAGSHHADSSPQTSVQIIVDIVEMIMYGVIHESPTSSSDQQQTQKATQRSRAVRRGWAPFRSAEVALVPHLIRILDRCSDAHTVQRAVRVLEVSARRKGLYDLRVPATVAKHALVLQQKLEQEHCPTGYPDDDNDNDDGDVGRARGDAREASEWAIISCGERNAVAGDVDSAGST